MKFFKQIGLNSQLKILIVGHDAGGANVLQSIVGQNEAIWSAIVAGPAKHIINSEITRISITDFKNNPEYFDVVIASTSWGSNLEKEVCVIAAENKVKFYILLDHWTFYSERLFHEGRQLKPEAIIVFDSFARKKISREFPENRILQVNNPYLDKIQRAYHKSNLKSKSQRRILYVTEPILEHFKIIKHKVGYDEYSLLSDFLEMFGAMDFEVKVRLHPSENINKYDDILCLTPKKITKSNAEDLLSDLQLCDVVIGAETMALHIAYELGLPVYTSIAPSLGEPGLPIKLKYMQELLNES